MPEETILILAKSYPECSRKHGCTVCVAGINELGEWRRIYPFKFDFFFTNRSFKKWDLVTMHLKKRAKNKDYRHESYDLLMSKGKEPSVVGSIDNQYKRLKFIEEHCDTSLCDLQKSDRSLGIIKPIELIDFKKKPRSRLKDKGELDVLDKMEITNLLDFMTPKQRALAKKGFIPKSLTEFDWIGYKYRCQHPDCRRHEMQSIDWETQELYRKMSDKYGEEQGFKKTKEKCLDWMKTRDLYFCVGTTWRFKRWMIISLLYPPKRVAQPLDKYFS